MNRSALAFLMTMTALPVSAQTIYRCIDAGGGTVIANARVDKSCKPVVMAPDSTMPAPRARAAAAATPTPSTFPKVPEDTQKSRDTDRRRILEQELAGEQRGLEQARRELAEHESARGAEGSAAGLDRLQPYRDRVSQHERNIVAIQKELSNLR